MCQFKIMVHHRGPAQDCGAAARVSSMLVAQHRFSVQDGGAAAYVNSILRRIIVCQFGVQHRFFSSTIVAHHSGWIVAHQLILVAQHRVSVQDGLWSNIMVSV
jgi:hypothetical protein